MPKLWDRIQNIWKDELAPVDPIPEWRKEEVRGANELAAHLSSELNGFRKQIQEEWERDLILSSVPLEMVDTRHEARLGMYNRVVQVLQDQQEEGKITVPVPALVLTDDMKESVNRNLEMSQKPTLEESEYEAEQEARDILQNRIYQKYAPTSEDASEEQYDRAHRKAELELNAMERHYPALSSQGLLKIYEENQPQVVVQSLDQMTEQHVAQHQEALRDLGGREPEQALSDASAREKLVDHVLSKNAPGWERGMEPNFDEAMRASVEIQGIIRSNPGLSGNELLASYENGRNMESYQLSHNPSDKSPEMSL